MQNGKKAEKGIFSLSPLRLFCVISAIVLTDENDVRLHAFKFEKGDEFTVRFIHSVNKTPVDEIFRIGDSGLELQETLFEDFNAGLQSYEEPGQKMELVGNKVRISGMRRAVPNLIYRVGQVVANHTLIFNGEQIPLSKFVKPGSAIRFKLEKWE